MEKESILEEEWQKCLSFLINLKTFVQKFQLENKNLLELANKVFFLEEGNYKTVGVKAVEEFLKQEIGNKTETFKRFRTKFLLELLIKDFLAFPH